MYQDRDTGPASDSSPGLLSFSADHLAGVATPAVRVYECETILFAVYGDEFSSTNDFLEAHARELSHGLHSSVTMQARHE